MGKYRLDRPARLLNHPHFPHAREHDKSAEVAVIHQPKLVWDASAELAHASWCSRRESNPEPRGLGAQRASRVRENLGEYASWGQPRP